MGTVIGTEKPSSNLWVWIIPVFFVLAGALNLLRGYVRMPSLYWPTALFSPLSGFASWGVPWFRSEEWMTIAPWLRFPEKVACIGLILVGFLWSKDRKLSLGVGLGIYGVSLFFQFVQVFKYGVAFSYSVSTTHFWAILTHGLVISILFLVLMGKSTTEKPNES